MTFIDLLIVIITASVLALLVGLKKIFILEQKILSVEEKILSLEEKIDKLLESKEGK